MRYTYVRQHDTTDCAAACLAMVCLHYKKEVTITRLRDMMGTDLKGTNLVGLQKAANELGFTTAAVRVDRENFLSDFSLPCIAQVITDQGLAHFVVVFKKTTIKDDGARRKHMLQDAEARKEEEEKGKKHKCKDSASSCGPARVSPPSFPRCRARSWRPSTPQTRSPDAGASAGTTPARAGRCGGESPLRLRLSGAAPPPAWPGKRSQTTAWSIRTSWTSWRIPARPGQCKVGKSYTRPDLHLPDSLAQHQDSLSFGDMDWWNIYTDSTLRGLIAKSLEYNKDILIAAARVKEMAAQKRISTAALLPDIKGTVTGEREFENHGGDAFKRNDTFEAQVLFSWELDLWGNLRWARSASIAEYLQSVEAQRALRMTIVSEVAQAYYELVALDTELEIVRQTLKAREEGMRLARIRFEGGLTSETSYRQSQVELARTAMHTSGVYPERLSKVLPLIEWVGLDIKAPFDEYELITGGGNGQRAKDSLIRILDSGKDYELRCTVDPLFFNPENAGKMARQLMELGVSHLVLQPYRDLVNRRTQAVSKEIITSIEQFLPVVKQRH